MYYVVYGFLWLISLLPLRVLYFFSDAIYGLVFYVLKYRKKVALDNLAIAFPEKTARERLRIAKDFYHNLVDTLVETIKMINMSPARIRKRFHGNWEVTNDIENPERCIQVHLGHNFNWEWGNASAAQFMTYPYLAVYMPLGSKVLEKIFYKLRTRYGTIMIKATRMKEEIIPHRNKRYLLALVADQNPGYPGNAWWIPFFGRLTPFVKGPAKGAISNDCEVFFAFIHKPRRGYYEVVFEKVPGASKLSEQELTIRFVEYLEAVIRRYPEMWLWSHRRWKHEWKPEYAESTLDRDN